MIRTEDIEEASEKLRNEWDFPHKGNHARENRYDTLMRYEIGDYVEEAFERGCEFILQHKAKHFEDEDLGEAFSFLYTEQNETVLCELFDYIEALRLKVRNLGAKS